MAFTSKPRHINQLRRIVRFYKAVDGVDENITELTPTDFVPYTYRFQDFCAVEGYGGMKQFMFRAQEVKPTHRITVRFRTDIDSTTWLILRSDSPPVDWRMKVLGVQDTEGLQVWLDILCFKTDDLPH